jgi:hypothetical protein
MRFYDDEPIVSTWTPALIDLAIDGNGVSKEDHDAAFILENYGATLLGAAEPNTEGDGK